jgi:hypothetical protein
MKAQPRGRQKARQISEAPLHGAFYLQAAANPQRGVSKKFTFIDAHVDTFQDWTI